ncbi:MAG: 30S ribosomal protein S2 [Rickettsiales bacterium]|nr:30S ribosomal protein S2 [Rickettsiales bacterium]
MALPAFNMRELIEAGVHFGHKTKRWNPRMAPYLYGVRNDIHIINLGKTVPMLHQALQAVRDAVAQNGRILFVGTKRQATTPIAEAAKRCGQYYINQRWLGGLLTNWNTIQVSIKQLRRLEEHLSDATLAFTKKELLAMSRERDKLEASLGGIKDMGGLPDLLFIIDTNKEDLAVKEAVKLGIPIVAIIDSNSSADGITYPIPGNDDSTRAINLYCRLVSDAVLDGIQHSMLASGKDLGASAELPDDVIAADLADAEPALAEAAKDDASEGKKAARSSRSKAPAKKAPTVTVKKTPGKAKKSEE